MLVMIRRKDTVSKRYDIYHSNKLKFYSLIKFKVVMFWAFEYSQKKGSALHLRVDS